MPLLLVLVALGWALWQAFGESSPSAPGFWDGGVSGEAGAGRALPFSLPADVDALAVQYSQQYGLDADLVRAQIWEESRGNAGALSPKGAMGLMQLMPKTAAGLGVTNAYDPVQNVEAGTRYFSKLVGQFGSYDKALAAYNWGEGRVARAGDSWASKLPAETSNYIRKIFADLGMSWDSVSGAEGYVNA